MPAPSRWPYLRWQICRPVSKGKLQAWLLVLGIEYNARTRQAPTSLALATIFRSHGGYPCTETINTNCKNKIAAAPQKIPMGCHTTSATAARVFQLVTSVFALLFLLFCYSGPTIHWLLSSSREARYANPCHCYLPPCMVRPRTAQEYLHLPCIGPASPACTGASSHLTSATGTGG